MDVLFASPLGCGSRMAFFCYREKTFLLSSTLARGIILGVESKLDVAVELTGMFFCSRLARRAFVNVGTGSLPSLL